MVTQSFWCRFAVVLIAITPFRCRAGRALLVAWRTIGSETRQGFARR
jgi:hypothetical protein